jgi:uncharacterized protein YegJ (DUF2314 family)
MKTRPFTAIAILIVLVATSSALAQTVLERANKDEMTLMPDEDPAMSKAFAKARAELDDFLQKKRSPPPNAEGFAVKVGIAEGKNTEYFWIVDFTERNGEFSGKINNEPRIAKSVKFDQVYMFRKSQIVDWTYVDTAQRRMMGNYTLCALLTREPPKEAEAARKRFKLDCGFLSER